MVSEESKNEDRQKKLSCLGVITSIGAFLGVLLAVVTGLNNLVELLLKLPNHFVVQISSFQISIGVTIVIALLILLLMGISFTLGMFYLMLTIATIFTKKKIPVFFQPFVALSYPFIRFVNWVFAQKYKARRENSPPSELQQRILTSLQERKAKK